MNIKFDILDLCESIEPYQFEIGDIIKYYGYEYTSHIGQDAFITSRRRAVNGNIYTFKFLKDNEIHSCLEDMLQLKKRIFSERELSERDPYGEENWSENEGMITKFKIFENKIRI